ncbi:MAG TPA: tRNA pseudouridine(55) synthase TruB [Wenzhouxiangella sp.]
MSPNPPHHGIVLLDKPEGLSSNQALGRAKRLFATKKAGHTGTLDPMATGLLVLCLGHATRVCAHLLDADKGYLADVHLGVMTDTEDKEGEVIETRSVPSLSEADVEALLANFLGPLQQVPPMYSALKHKGERLYDLARRGESVARPPRAVTIHSLTVTDWRLDDPETPGFSFEVTCTKGTYIRSLVRDIGEALGCGAHLCGLRRTQAAPFHIDQASTLEQLESLDTEALLDRLLPIQAALPHWPRVCLDASAQRAFEHGQAIDRASLTEAGDIATDQWVCVLANDRCIGLAQMSKRALQPRAVFPTSA